MDCTTLGFPAHHQLPELTQRKSLFDLVRSFSSVQFGSVTQSCPTLWDPMDCSTSGLPVHRQLLEFTQTHPLSRWCHPIISSSVVPFSSQHQGLFQWISSLHQVAKLLELQLQHQSFQWIFRADFLWDGLVGSPCSPRDSQESSPTLQLKASILGRSAFFIVQLSHPYMTSGKTVALTR